MHKKQLKRTFVRKKRGGSLFVSGGLIEEENIKGGPGSPKLKKNIQKNWGSMGGGHMSRIFFRIFCFSKSSAGKC